jgi:hypothetical protein
MQERAPAIDVLDIIQKIRQHPQSSFEYWIMLGSIFAEETSPVPINASGILPQSLSTPRGRINL